MEAAKNGVNDVYGYTQINPTFTPTLKKYLLRWLETHIDINVYFNWLNPKKTSAFAEVMVPGAGLEPARPQGRGILSPLRLPVSPPGRH